MLQTSLNVEWKGTGSLQRPQDGGDYCSGVDVPSEFGAFPGGSG